MSPTRRTHQSWNALEITKVLEYINNHFDSWCDNHIATCAKAVKASNIDREAKAVYNKVYNMTKAMEDYVKTKKRPKNYDIIWQNKRISALLKEIGKKTEERDRGKKENQETTRVANIDQVTRERRRDSQDSNTTKETTRVEMTTNTDRITTKVFTSRMNQIDKMDVDDQIDLEIVDNLKESVDANYKEFYEFYGLTGQINQERSELRDIKGRINQRRSQLEVMEEKYFQLCTELKDMENKVVQRRSEIKEMKEKFKQKSSVLKEKVDRWELSKRNFTNFLPSK